MAPTATRVMNADTAPPARAPPPQGNLDSVLTSYDHSQNQNHESLGAPASLTINIPGRSSTTTTNQQHQQEHHQDSSGDDENDRERSLTLGSEFDLNWALGKDGRGMSISGLLTPLGEPDQPGVGDGMSEATSTTVGTGSTSSTTQHHHHYNNATNNYDGSSSAAAFASTFLPRLPENTTATVPGFTSANVPVHNSNNTAGQYQHNVPARSRGDSTASQFLNGLLYPQHHQQPSSSLLGKTMIAHTPPTHMGTSYENSHFGKRMRSGSISGRLRSASDLEDTGVISREQKAILKDLIIAGDNSVQGAIDKWETGDPSALEEMIKNGALLARSSDVDLLGDLDLDFLNVHDEDDDGMMFGHMEDIGGNTSTNNAVMGESSNGRQQQGGDGLGELEFNGDFTNLNMEPRQVLGNSSFQNVHPSVVHSKARGNSVDDLEVYRMRTNSLALPGLLLDGANPDDVASISFGRWMDKEIANPTPLPPPQPPHAAQIQGPAPTQQQGQQRAPNIVDANGTQYILNPSRECDVLMASKSKGPPSSAGKTTPPAALRDKKPKVKKEKIKKTSTAKKDKKDGPRERKSQSKMKDMMESITSSDKKTSATSAAAAAAAGEEEENKDVPSGLGRPRSMSDPNLSVRLDDHGLLHVNGPDGWVGAYSPDSRHMRINRFMEKRNHRVWVKKVKYDVRKNFADSRLRVKGRFVKKEDEMLMRDLISLT